MSVKQLSKGEWFYRFQHGKRTHRRQGFKTRKEAEKAESRLKHELDRRSRYDGDIDNNLRLVDATKMFFEEYSVPLKRTASTDRAHFRVINAFFRNKRIRDISHREVEAFRLHVRKTVKNRQGNPISLHTVNHYHATLKALINWTKKKRLYFGENPAWGVEMAKVPKVKVRYLSPEEEKRLTPVVAKNSLLWPYYVIALHTGMRLNEVCSIRVKDVIKHPDPMIFIPNSKTSRSRYVPLYGKAQEVVKECLKKAHSPEEKLLHPVTPTTISKWFNQAVKEAKVLAEPTFTFHCLRHTFAAHMLSKGTAIYKVSKIMGHSTSRTTEEHYGHFDRSVLSEEIHKIGSLMTVPEAVKRIMQTEIVGRS